MQVNTPIMQTFLHGPINLHGSPILFAILQLSTYNQKLIAQNVFPKWIGRTLIVKKLEHIKTANNKNQLKADVDVKSNQFTLFRYRGQLNVKLLDF